MTKQLATLLVDRSKTPWKPSPSPMGQFIGQHSNPNSFSNYKRKKGKTGKKILIEKKEEM